MNPYAQLMAEHDPHQYYVPSWLQGLLADLGGRSPSSIDLVGLPGMGKTSVLEYIAHPFGAFATDLTVQNQQTVPSAFIFSVLVRCNELTSVRRLYQSIYDAIHRGLPGFHRRTGLQWTGSARDVGTSASGPDDTADRVESILKWLRVRGAHSILLLDNFDVPFNSMTIGETTRMRPWRDLVSIVLTTQRPLYLVNAVAAGSPFYNTMPVRWINGVMDRDVALRLISRPAISSGKPFPGPDADTIYELTEGHPFATILAARMLWDAREKLGILDEPGVPLPPVELDNLRQLLQHSLANLFDQYRRLLSDAERSALKGIAHAVPGAMNQMHTINHLKEMGLVRGRNDGLMLSRLFGEYIRTSF